MYYEVQEGLMCVWWTINKPAEGAVAGWIIWCSCRAEEPPKSSVVIWWRSGLKHVLRKELETWSCLRLQYKYIKPLFRLHMIFDLNNILEITLKMKNENVATWYKRITKARSSLLHNLYCIHTIDIFQNTTWHFVAIALQYELKFFLSYSPTCSFWQ